MRRRRFRTKVEPVRRERPALIECFGTRATNVAVPLGNETYLFLPDGRGRKVAHVELEDHIACFLARADMYRELR